MTVPSEYRTASRDFERFMADLREVSQLATEHQCYHMLRAVLHVFRSHLDVADALTFAQVLPPVLRAIFVENWTPGSPSDFPDRAALQAEVLDVRHNHNISTPTAIEDVSEALRRNVNEAELRRVPAGLPDGATRFWFG